MGIHTLKIFSSSMKLNASEVNTPTILHSSQPTRHSKGIITTILCSLTPILLILSHHKKKEFVIGIMGGRMGLLFLVLLGVAWACDARELANSDRWNIIAANCGSSELRRTPDVCELCEEYTSKALDYLNENKTQNEIIDMLHSTCHQFLSFEKKCIALVDYYVPLFFLEMASVQPGDFCNKVNLCQSITNLSLQVQENSCEFCKDTVSALLAKLTDPDTELEIIETLLKVCSSVDKYANKCKRLVLDYGPLVFDNAQKFLETTDICTALHACRDSKLLGKSFVADLLSVYYGNNFTRVVRLLKIALYWGRDRGDQI